MSATLDGGGAGNAHRVDFRAEVERLRRDRNAVILAHYYQDDELQDVADFIGDSLQLAKAARDTKADVIAFCGVHFMAETAKILNPDRIVVVPDMKAGCSLADGCPAPKLKAWKDAHPDHLVVSYINCTAGAKALSDIICTSSNAKRVVASLPADKPILFAPDRNLGGWVMRETGRKMDLWPATCIVHETFSERRLVELMAAHPEAKVIAHPECEPPVLALAHHIGSTSSLLDYVTNNVAIREFIIATEPGIIHQMQKTRPDANLIPLPGRDETCACNECPFMRMNTMEKLYLALRDLQPRIEMDEAVRRAALKPLERMMALG
jgi:quinolinate synthase